MKIMRIFHYFKFENDFLLLIGEHSFYILLFVHRKWKLQFFKKIENGKQKIVFHK